MHEHITSLNDALNDALEGCESCEAAVASVAAKYDAAVEHGIVGYNLALDGAMENLSQAHERFIKMIITQVKVALEANAGDPNAAKPALAAPVGADGLEEHNTATPEKTVEHNTVAPEGTVEHNTAAPEEEKHNPAAPEETVRGEDRGSWAFLD